MTIKVTPNQLPYGEYRDVLEDAFNRGIKIMGSEHSVEGNFLLIIGLADIINEIKGNKGGC